jgi:phosphoglucosamine mutase
MKLFGSSGIRGLALVEITPQMAQKLGEVLGTIHKRVVIGRDPRTSGPLLVNAFSSGLLSTGCEVYLAEMVTTPTLAYVARSFDCGIMVTASHNPPQYNGFKFINSDGSGFDVSQMEEIEKIYEENNISKALWDAIKTPKPYHNAIEEHIQSIEKKAKSLDLKVVIDCGCGSASTITPYLLGRLGCRIVSINCQPDGFFPGRSSEPTSESLGLLKECVVSNKADLGIAHDGDADRMVAVDEKGNFVGGDGLLTLFAKHEVKNTLVVPVNASMAVDEQVGGATVIRTRVGDVFISQKIKEHSADFGGEPSGTWIFPEQNLCPDGIFAAVKLAELVEKEPLSKQIENLPKYPRKKGTISCVNEKKYIALENIKKQLDALGYNDLNTQDGLRVQFENSWALIRASGTEPKIRITIETKDESEVENLYNKIYELVKGCVVQ